MTEVKKREKLLLRILHLVSAKYKNLVVLKGGMALRLYNSPRHTQDIDFVMVTKTSRKIIAAEIETLLKKEGGIEIAETRLNSRGIFMDVRSEGVLVQIEISVQKELHCPPDAMTTAAIAAPLKMPAQIITVMSRSESFSHKISACLERKTMRDLYDLSLYEPNTGFDEGTLKARLSELAIDRQKPKSISFAEAASRLRKRVASLKQEDMTKELKGLVPEHYLTHSAELIKNSVERLCQSLEKIR
jgi:predicted nucleotidyltransferase component of viral defense system